MKKRKILFLFPLVGLLLTGCSFEEVLANAQTWLNDKIVQPAKDFIDNITGGGKEEKKEDEGGKDEEKTVKRILVESYPESVAEGATIEASAVTVRVFYSDNTEELKQAEKVTIDTSVPGDNVPMTVEYGGKTDTVTVKVVAASEVVHVESIKYDTGGVYTIDVGAELQITVNVEPENATDKSCTFTSSNEQIATVTSGGLVKGVSAGQVSIQIVSNDNPEAKKTLNLTIRAEAAGLPNKTARGFDKLEATVELLNGEKVNIAGAIGEQYYVLPTYESGNNIKAKAINAENEALVIDEAYDLTALKNANGTYSFMQANGKYLAATGASSGNQLKAIDAIDERAQFNVTVEDGYTFISAPAVERGSLCLNPNSGNPIFACYVEAKYEKYALYHNGQGTTGPVAVEGIAFTEQAYELEVGSTVEVVANVTPATADDKEVSYSLKDVEPEGALTIQGNVISASAVGTAKVVATSHDGGYQAEASVKSNEATNPVHAGTLADPYDGADAMLVGNKLKAGEKTSESFYVKGKVQKFVESFNPSYGNYTFLIEDGFEGFRLLNGPEKAKFTTGSELEVGDTVTMYGPIQNYSGTIEMPNSGYIYSIEKPAVEAELVSIAISGTAKSVYVEDDAYTAAGLAVTATYDNQQTQDVTSQVTWSFSKETAALGDESVTITAAFQDKTASIDVTVTVTEKPVTEHAGTLEDPYTGADASAVAAKLDDKAATADSFYIKGVVESFEENFNPSYGNYSFKIDGGFIGWRLLNGSEKAKFAAGDLEVGDTVTMYAQIQNYGGKPETKGGYIHSIEKKVITAELVGIEITGNAKAEYTEGEDYTAAGLSVMASYDDQSVLDVTAKATITLSKEKAELGDESFTVTAAYENKTAELVVNVTVTAAPTESPIEEGTYFLKAAAGETYYYLKANGTDSAPSAVSSTAQATKLVFSLVEGKTNEYTIATEDGQFMYSTDANNGIRFAAEVPSGAGSVWKIEDGSRDGAGFDISTATGSKTRYVSLYNTQDFRGYDSPTATNRKVNTELEVPSAEIPTIASIKITGEAKTAYTEGDAYSAAGLKVMAVYTDQSEVDVTANSTLTLSKETAELGDESIKVTAAYGEFTAELTVNVTVAEKGDTPVTDDAVFTLGDDGSASHLDGSAASTYEETNNGKTLSIKDGVKMYTGARDAKGNGCLKFGTSSAAASFKIDLANVSGVKQIVIKAAQYKSRTDCTISLNGGEATTLTCKSDNGQYDEITFDVGEATELSVAFSGRAMVNEIVFVL